MGERGSSSSSSSSVRSHLVTGHTGVLGPVSQRGQPETQHRDYESLH